LFLFKTTITGFFKKTGGLFFLKKPGF